MPLQNYLPALALAVFAAALGSCLSPPDFPNTPKVTFIGLSRDTMVQGSLLQDSLTVVIGFEDGDGDIAADGGDSDTATVFLNNIKTGDIVAEYKIDPIDDNGLENGISGEFRLRMYTTCCDYPLFVNALPCELSDEYPIDTLLLEAYIVDRAGNESNRAAVAPIYLQCDRTK